MCIPTNIFFVPEKHCAQLIVILWRIMQTTLYNIYVYFYTPISIGKIEFPPLSSQQPHPCVSLKPFRNPYIRFLCMERKRLEKQMAMNI